MTATLGEVTRLFLRLGTTAFGGPAAHIAIMEDEVVRRKQWLTHAEFLDLVSAANLIPGPNSTELAIHIGYRVAGWRGLLLGGIAFILPASLIVGTLAWLYVRFGTLPTLQAVLLGVKPVVMVVVLQALWKLGRSCVRTGWQAGWATLLFGMSWLGLHELALLFGSGLLFALGRAARQRPTLMLVVPFVPCVGQASVPFTTPSLFAFFLKVGSVLFGSGYVLLAFLRADLVERYGWLTEQQLLDAIAIGQVTPGPVFTTATFIGYLLDGPQGALVATVGIFLPAFIFVALSAPLLPKLRQSPTLSAFLDGLNIASLALMAAVAIPLGQAALGNAFTLSIAVVSGILLWRTRLNTTWLILAGACSGFIRECI